MSIAPIDYSAFQRNPVGIEAVLSRGGSAFSSILRDAMQVGRDRANRQASQEKDFLGEQRRDINLNQRRAELQQQDFEDAQNFGEGVRRFDTSFGENVRQFDVRASQTDAEIGLRREAGYRDERRLDLAEDGAAFERDQLRPLQLQGAQLKLEGDKQQIETEKTRLEAERARIANYKNEGERAAATASYQQDLNDMRQGHLTQFDAYVRGGETEAAKSLFRQITENPIYEMDTDTKGRMAAQVGLEFERPSSSGSSGSTSAMAPPEDMSLDQIDAELKIAEPAAGGTSAGKPSEKLSLRIEALKRQKERLEKNSPTGRKSEAERLKELGRAGRSGPFR